MKNNQCSIAVGSVCLLIGIALNAIIFHVGSEIVVFGFLFALRHLIRWRTALTIMSTMIVLNAMENVQAVFTLASYIDSVMARMPAMTMLPASELSIIMSIAKAILLFATLTLTMIAAAGASVTLGFVIRHTIKKRGILGLH